MARSIDYYFYSASPFTYLGHQAIVDVAKKHGATLNYKPVDLMAIWAVSGAVPPAQRPEVRQRMRLVELQRIAHMRGLPINPKPAHFPVDAALADKAIIALVQNKIDPEAFATRVFQAVWAEDKNISDRRLLADMLSATKADPESILKQAETDEIAAIRAGNSTAAIDIDAPGVPTYALDGEAFWGQDRVEHLDHALSFPRAPFTSSV